jgi:lysophospholipase L1-like esterase
MQQRPFSHLKVLSACLVVTILAMFAQGCASLCDSKPVNVGADNSSIRYSGRSEGIGTGEVTLGYSGARVRLRFEGTSVAVRIKDDTGENYAVAWVDGKMGQKFRLNSKESYYLLADGLPSGIHTVEVVRLTECYIGLTHFEGFVLNSGAKVLPWLDAHQRRIEFIGDSITCGYGIEANDPKLHFSPDTENFCLDYSGLTARHLDADYLVVSRSGIGIFRNYDGPYEGSEGTMPEVYPNTFYLHQSTWDFSRYTPDVVCINLGTNDFSTKGVNVDKFVAAYIDFAGKVLERYPNAKLVILQGPMDNSAALKGALGRVVDELSKKTPGRVTYFELSAQGQVGLGADYHPNRAQSEINSGELTRYLSTLMGWN